MSTHFVHIFTFIFSFSAMASVTSLQCVRIDCLLVLLAVALVHVHELGQVHFAQVLTLSDLGVGRILTGETRDNYDYGSSDHVGQFYKLAFWIAKKITHLARYEISF